MAKRSAAGKTGINNSQEMRSIVEANKEITGAEAMAVLRGKFPKQTFNVESCLVAYSNARKKFGLTKTVVKLPASGRPHSRAASAAAPTAAVAGSLDISLMQAAKALLQHCKGDVYAAHSALEQIASFQLE